MFRTPSQDELLALRGRRMPLGELLAFFGTRRRTELAVQHIERVLKDAHLATLPYFVTCGLQSDIHIVPSESVPEEESDERGEDDEAGLAPGALPHQSFRIGHLPSAVAGVDSVSPSQDVTEAMYLMRQKNYSQIPVLDGQYAVIGVVTWRSVTKMYSTGLRVALTNALVEDPPIVSVRDDFFAQLPRICEHGYVLVRDDNGRISGIVTTTDVTERFNVTAWPFFVIGEIEFRLRRCLGAKIDADAIRAVQRYGDSGDIADLMFGEYVKLLDGDQRDKKGNRREALCAAADKNWEALGWPGVNRLQFVHQLDRVRDIRNQIAHFDPEPLSPQRSEELRQFVNLLRQLT